MDTESVLTVENKKTQWCQNFNKKVRDGNFCLAVTAFSTEKQVGKDRNIIIEFYSLFAVRTGRRRMNNTYSKGNSIYDYI